MARSPSVTELLVSWSNGNKDDLDRLMPLIYNELRRLAGAYLRGERAGHTLQATALANEAYLRLVDQNHVSWQNRAHFFAVAAQIMRRILVDHARRRHAAMRGGDATRLSFDEAIDVPADQKATDVDVVALDQALDRLSAMDERQGRIVELRFFGGLTVKETSEVLGLSPITVKREWATAKAWLFRELQTGTTRSGAP